MTQMKYAHPLQWPSSVARTPKWDRSINQNFKANMTMEEALMLLKDELDAIPAHSATLISDYQGLEQPRLMKKVGQENAVVLRLKYNDRMYEIPCDRWVQAEHNIYAIHLALRNLRTIAGWGVGTVDQAFGGFLQGGQSFTSDAHAGGATTVGYAAAGGNNNQPKLEEWRLFLGLGPTATIEDAHAVYRRRAKLVADSQEELTKLNLAMDAASKALGI